MSLTKTEHWETMAKQHEDFVEKVNESGYPLWMLEMYSCPPTYALEHEMEQERN